MIPAFNEQDTIAQVISSIPRQVEGFSETKILVIDDGSVDNTVQVARNSGADRLFQLGKNQGLASAFSKGLEQAVAMGAQVIVNIDADGQYNASEIGKLCKPILEGKADMVIGNRQVKKLTFMPFSKKYGNRLGSWLVRKLSGTSVIDASSGFRAFTRDTSLRLNVLANHTYTHETIIDAASKGLVIANVDVEFLPTSRAGGKSRLIHNVLTHVKNSLLIIVRTFVLYRPLKAFSILGAVFISGAVLIGVRFIYYFTQGQGDGKIQSLIFAAILAIVGFQIIIMGFLADATSVSRKVSENILLEIKSRNNEKI